MRHLPDVVRAVLEEIPATEIGIIDDIKKLQRQVDWLAPEQMGPYWDAVGTVLLKYFKLPSDGLVAWQKSVIDIWLDKRTSYRVHIKRYNQKAI